MFDSAKFVLGPVLGMFVGLSPAVGCDGSGETEETSSSSSASSGGGTRCYSVPINENGDGTQSCGPTVCDGGEYCMSTVGICDPGCLSQQDCKNREYCDLSNAMQNDDGDPVGVCRVPGPDLEVMCMGGAGGNMGTTCVSRCTARAATCMAPASQAETLCNQLCGSSPTEMQLTCIEETPCMELEEAFEMGSPLCGLGG